MLLGNFQIIELKVQEYFHFQERIMEANITILLSRRDNNYKHNANEKREDFAGSMKMLDIIILRTIRLRV